MENKNIYDLVIVGGGPAGLTAAIYARRANLSVLILEAGAPGGKMVTTAEIENWPGIKNTSGPDLAFQMFDHATSLNAVYEYGDVVEIKQGTPKEVICANDAVYYGKTVLIATGTVERKLGVPGEQRLTNHGVSYCAVCDGAFYKEKIVTVIGGGNSALEEAIYLTKFASQVNVVIRRDVFRADKLIQDKLYANEKINVIVKSIPHEVIGDKVVTGIILENVDTNKLITIPTDGVFPFIGLDPKTGFAKDLNILNEFEYIIADKDMKTSQEGIFAAGDVIEKNLRQVVTAANDGAIAAQEIIKHLEENHV